MLFYIRNFEAFSLPPTHFEVAILSLLQLILFCLWFNRLVSLVQSLIVTADIDLKFAPLRVFIGSKMFGYCVRNTNNLLFIPSPLIWYYAYCCVGRSETIGICSQLQRPISEQCCDSRCRVWSTSCLTVVITDWKRLFCFNLMQKNTSTSLE